MPYEKIGKETRCIADEIPFEIPDSWEWVTFRHIAITELGKTLDKAKNQGTLQPYLCSINVYWTGIDLSKVKQAKFENDELERFLLQKGDLLVCEGGDIGRCAIWDSDQTMYYQNALHRIRFFANLNSRYFRFLLECYKGIGIIDQYSKGMTIKHLVQSSLNSIMIPLPPLAEQKRIVAKIEELLPHLDDYDRAETRVSKLNAEFPEQLKKSILQWAILGKLVPQDPADEPASVLLERIRAEKAKLVKAGKIKKDKNESVIFRRDNSHYTVQDGKEICVDAKLPFDLPEGWAWCKLQTVTINIHYGYTASAAAKGNAKLLRITDIQDNQVIWDNVPFCSISKGDLPTYQIHDRDIMIARTGGTIGKTYIVRGLSETAVFASYLIRAIPVPEINEEYLKLFMESPFYWTQLKDFSSGTGQPNVNGQSLKNLILPLPPLPEQKRIVEFYFSVFPEIKSLTQFSL